MSIRQTLLRPAAYLAGLHASAQVRAFMKAHERTAQVQRQVLDQLLRAHAPTDFGRDHGLGRIRGYEDFAKAVPVGNYETLRPYMDRVLQGHTAALLPPGDEVLMFSQTSGTTGRPKLIPVTRRFADMMRRGWNIFGLRMLRDHPQAWMRQIMQISSPMRETDSPTGLPCGAISGLLATRQKKIVRRMYVVPPEVSTIHDPSARFYTILRCGIGRDVSIITTANPSTTIKLIETGRQHCQRLLKDLADGTFTPPGEVDPRSVKGVRFTRNRQLARAVEQAVARDGALLPRHFWNVAILTNWTGGTLKLYLPRLRELFGPVAIRDIGLLASEGRFSVPLADDTPAGVAEITGNFLEFLPVEEASSPSPRTVLAHEAQVGAEYFLVLTNWAGLWRYNIDDRVRVTGRLGGSPIFEFLSRGLHTANITGEKITEHQVVEAMRRACAALGAAVERFVMQGRFVAASGGSAGQPAPFYELRLDEQPVLNAQALAARMDEELAALNIEYQSKRASGRLGAIRANMLPPRTLEKAEAENILKRHGRNEQYKHKYLLPEVLET